MKLRSRLTAITVATMLSTTALVAQATPTPAPSYQTQQEMLKSTTEGLTALTKAHEARVALFDNDIEAAKGRLAEARAEFLDSEKLLNDYTIGDTENPEEGARFLPIDMSLSVTEGFKPTEESTTALKNAHEMMQKGEQDNAINTLRAANVDMQITTALLPVADVTDNLQRAHNFLDAGKYHEANLALKAVEDSVLIRTYSIDAIPAQGSQG